MSTYQSVDNSFLRSTFAPIWDLLEDDAINEIKTSPCEKNLAQVWAKKNGAWFECKDKTNKLIRLGDLKINSIIEFIAGAEGKWAHEKVNIVEASIPFMNYRFTGVKQPTAVGCAGFNIRKHNSRIFTFEDYNNFGTFPEYVNNMLFDWMHGKTSKEYRSSMSIAIFGLPESGKTAFQNCYIDYKRKFFPTENWVVIEDTRELNIGIGNVTRSQCNEYHNLDKLLITAKRQSPDNLVIGEVRGAEAALVLESSLIFSTIFGMHANSFQSALKSLETMALKNKFTSNSFNRRDLLNITGWIGFKNVPIYEEDKYGNQVLTVRKRLSEMVELTKYDNNADEFQSSTLYTYEQVA